MCSQPFALANSQMLIKNSIGICWKTKQNETLVVDLLNATPCCSSISCRLERTTPHVFTHGILGIENRVTLLYFLSEAWEDSKSYRKLFHTTLAQ